MKKKAVLLLMTGCLTIGTLFAGCSAKEVAETTVAETEEKEDEEEEEGKVKKEKEEDDTEENSTEEKEEDDTEEESKNSAPVLGDEDASGYEGFEYLYEEELMTDAEENEETGKMEKTRLTVYIPKADSTSVNRDYAYANKMGVSFDIKLEPYLQYKQEDYTAEENLQAYIDEEYDEFRTTDLKDLELSEVEAADDTTATAYAKYCKYDSWEEEYQVIYKTYYLKEVEPEIYVMVEVEVNSLEATAKTPKMLEELSAFYGVDMQWDADEAQAKLDNFLANDDSDVETVSTGFLKFDLPKGWEEDTSVSKYGMTVYAPDGDTDFAECAIAVLNEYMGSDMDNVVELLLSEEFVDQYVTGQFGDEVTNVKVEEYGTTCIGETIMLECTYVDGDDEVNCRFYMSGKGSSLYAIEAMQFEGAEEDVFQIAEDILANGKFNE